jgi:hypothetical protein
VVAGVGGLGAVALVTKFMFMSVHTAGPSPAGFSSPGAEAAKVSATPVPPSGEFGQAAVAMVEIKSGGIILGV